MSLVVSAHVAMGKMWHGTAVQAGISRAGICIQRLSTCDQGEVVPPPGGASLEARISQWFLQLGDLGKL